MSGKELKHKYPDFAKRNNINNEDIIYLVGDKIKILRKK